MKQGMAGSSNRTTALLAGCVLLLAAAANRAIAGQQQDVHRDAVEKGVQYLLTKGESADGSYSAGREQASRRCASPRDCAAADRRTIPPSPRVSNIWKAMYGPTEASTRKTRG